MTADELAAIPRRKIVYWENVGRVTADEIEALLIRHGKRVPGQRKIRRRFIVEIHPEPDTTGLEQALKATVRVVAPQSTLVRFEVDIEEDEDAQGVMALQEQIKTAVQHLGSAVMVRRT